MKIRDILQQAVGTKGLEVSGVLKVVMPAKTREGKDGEFKSQFLVVKDDTGELGVNLNEKELAQELKGTEITITNGTLGSYVGGDGETKYTLNIAKSGKVIMPGGIQESSPPPESKPAPESGKGGGGQEGRSLVGVAKNLDTAIEIATDVLTTDKARDLLIKAKAKGWDSTDVRELVIKIFAQLSRG